MSKEESVWKIIFATIGIKMDHFAHSGISILNLILRIKKWLLLTLIFCLTTLMPQGCKSPNEPGGSSKQGRLTVEDVSCTEAWLKVEAGNLSLPSDVTITKDGNAQFKFTLSAKDTTVYDNSLLPGKDYIYQVEFSSGNKESVSIRTIDTTSHSFSWQIFKIGNYGTWIRDVAIINDTLIYAVGEFYKNLPNGQEDPHTYSLAKWDGHSWSLKRLYYKYKDYESKEVIAPITVPISCILPFKNDDIWFSSGSVFHWNGQDSLIELSISRLSLIDSVENGKSLDQIWGTGSDNIYAAGNNGTLAHYDGHKWEVIESGTNLAFYDIWGGLNSLNSKPEVLAVGSIILTHSGRVIEKLDGLKAENISTEGIPYNITTVWFMPDKAYYIAADRLYYKHRLTDPIWTEITSLTKFDITDIYGPDRNDILITSAYGDILHFNGKGWRSYYDQTMLPYGDYVAVKLKNNLAVAVGSYSDSQGVIAIGRR